MNLTIEQKNQLLELVKQIKVKSCDRCLSYDSDGVCLEFNSKVPESHITKGCDKWEEAIPF